MWMHLCRAHVFAPFIDTFFALKPHIPYRNALPSNEMQKTFADCNFLIEKLKGGIEIKKKKLYCIYHFMFSAIYQYICAY